VGETNSPVYPQLVTRVMAPHHHLLEMCVCVCVKMCVCVRERQRERNRTKVGNVSTLPDGDVGVCMGERERIVLQHHLLGG